jgi:Zn-dependent peptidase ImmA (M78 family)/DNA-binding Xre family transcriptional regulator
MRSQRIIIARESRGFTQKDLSKATDISQSQISKYEQDTKELSEMDMEKIANALDYPLSFFTKKIETHTVHLDFRKGKLPTDKLQRKITAIVNRTRYEINNLLQELDKESIVVPENILSSKPSEAARHLRNFWKIPKGPIQNLMEEVEEKSIILMPMKFLDQEKFTACALDLSYCNPLIIYNATHSMDRIRFSIAHELGHIYLHHHGEQDSDFSVPYEFNQKIKEEQANEFASEFLMPEVEITRDLTGLTIEKLQQLKFKWKVSMAALLERAKRLTIINEQKYINFRKEFSYRKWLLEEPGKLPIEEPFLLNEIIEAYQKDLGYSRKEIAERIGLSEKELLSIYFGKFQLSVVQSKKISKTSIR